MSRVRFAENNNFEDETTPLQHNEEQHANISEEKWNYFDEVPIKEESKSLDNKEFQELSLKIIKFIIYIVTFVIVLGAGVIAKGTLLFMTSQLNSEKVLPYCNRDLERGRQFVVQLSEEERIAWMWCIFFVFCVPEVLTFLKSLRICIFKKTKKKSKNEEPATKLTFIPFLLLFLAETAHTTGLAIFVYYVLPNLDVIKGVMLTNCVCFIPALISLGKINYESKNKKYWSIIKNYWIKIIDLIAICAQITGFVVWPLIENKIELWLIPVSLFLISCGWWENYLPEKSSFKTLKQKLNKTRYYYYSFISIWKMIYFLGTATLIIWIQENNFNFLTDIQSAFESHNVTVREIKPIIQDTSVLDISENHIPILASTLTPIYVFLINICATYLMYLFGKFACKVMIQGFGYAFPVNLTVPVTISLLITVCSLRRSDSCYFHNVIPSYLFFESPPIDLFDDFIFKQYAWIWLLWLLSQTWITLHIWTPKFERVQTSEKLFVTPLYNAFLIDQSMALNRRIDNYANSSKNEIDENEIKDSDKIKRLKICATMWHESKDEMKEFLKSVVRMDIDQAPKRCARERWKIYDPDYYELETHIFFDDAIKKLEKSAYKRQINQYVKDFINLIKEAINDVHGSPRNISCATKILTPYGGRLEFTLPGKSQMIVHLKDSSQIRHKKRWSQVMYMYYLLGFGLNSLDLPINRKEMIADNTFLLALDGDIDFQPEAVHLLLDKMKDIKVGAACGRIHPIGSGAMVWYQKFEYAIGHWLQKATEHVIGCVLCSPGCFSIFRASALMETNVMKKYTKKSTEALHFVQFDQGEDRWLCTLLLQRQFRIEYCAAADAYTHCPESFNDFYVQRKRWIPSTIANIWDLLQNSKHVIQNNESISTAYIIYQYLLMAGTILGPGTIFLMLVGAFVAVFDIDNWTSFYYNAIPILIFIFVCTFFKSDIQLIVAAVISAVYGLIMMAVLVGIILQMQSDGLLAPTSAFFFLVAGEIIITALLHPQELNCLPCGVIYYVTIPSMYLLLIVYAAFNMNDVNWGTRQDKPQEEQQNKKSKKKSLLSFLQNKNEKNEEGSVEFSLAGLFKCVCCTHEKISEEKMQLLEIAEKLDRIEKNQNQPTERRESLSTSSEAETNSVEDTDNDELLDEETNPAVIERNRSDWIGDSELEIEHIGYLSENEENFWINMIKKYLLPIPPNEIAQKLINKELKHLRDKVLFGFFMLNSLFVLIVFLLTLKKDLLHINWPFNIKSNVTYDASLQEVHITKTYLELEPIGLVFLFFFALILVIQFSAMLYHRLGTFTQILAHVQLNFWNIKKKDKVRTNDDLHKFGLKYAKIILEMGDANNSVVEEENLPSNGRRRTLYRLENSARRRAGVDGRTIQTLDDTFNKNVDRLMNDRDETKKRNINVDILKQLDNYSNQNQMARANRNEQIPNRRSDNGFDNDGFINNDNNNVNSRLPYNFEQDHNLDVTV